MKTAAVQKSLIKVQELKKGVQRSPQQEKSKEILLWPPSCGQSRAIVVKVDMALTTLTL